MVAPPAGQPHATLYAYDDQDRLRCEGPSDPALALQITIACPDAGAGATSYDWTPAGSLRRKTDGAGEVTEYEYDPFGNLRRVVLDAGDPANESEISYAIDTRNRRVGRRTPDAATGTPTLTQALTYGNQLEPIAELDPDTGDVLAEYAYGAHPHSPDLFLSSAGGGTTYRVVADHLGTARLVIDTTTGQVAQRLAYDPWGRVLLDTTPGLQPFGFVGGVHDASSGLIRFGARDYDPRSGRWTAKDPIRFRGGDPNVYRYIAGDPLNAADPSGLFQPAGAGGAALLGGLGGGGAAAGAGAALGAGLGALGLGIGLGLGIDALLGDDIQSGLDKLLGPANPDLDRDPDRRHGGDRPPQCDDRPERRVPCHLTWQQRTSLGTICWYDCDDGESEFFFRTPATVPA